MVRKIGVALALITLAGAALASGSERRGNDIVRVHPTERSNGEGEGNSASVVAAPEIDPASAIAALTLMAGGVAVLRGRRVKT